MLGVNKLETNDELLEFSSQIYKVVAEIFFWIVEMIIVNAYIIHKKTQADTDNNMTHLAFKKS